MPSLSRHPAWISWIILAASVALALATLGAAWATNAETLGAQDAGLALFLAFASGAGLLGALYATPPLALAGLVLLFRHRDAGLRLLAAAVVLSVPLVAELWIH